VTGQTGRASPPAAQLSDPVQGPRRRGRWAVALHPTSGQVVLTALVACFVLFSVSSPDFLTVPNLRVLLVTASVTGVVAVGATLALGAGCIDFSVAAVMALSGVVCASVTAAAGPAAGVLAGLGAGVAVGCLNGACVLVLQLNPFLATLATAGAVRGAAFLVAGSTAGVLMPDGPLLDLSAALVAGVPLYGWIFALLSSSVFYVLRWTRTGRALLATGDHVAAARLAGIPTQRWQAVGYVAVATCAALGGVLLSARTGAGIPQAATGQELLIYAAVILGGTSLWGGRVSVGGTVAGILLLVTVANGLAVTQTSPYWQQILQGAALVIAVWVGAATARARAQALVRPR
jgi:ribose transport system permease protein